MNSMKDVEGNEPEAPEGPKMYMGVPLEDLIGTDEHGLTEAEAAERLKKFGKNEVEEKTVHPLVKLVKPFVGPQVDPHHDPDPPPSSSMPKRGHARRRRD